MRSLVLARPGLNKIRSQQKELKATDLADSIKSVTPGEWCTFMHPELTSSWLGFVNPLIDEKYSCVHLIKPLGAQEGEQFSIENLIGSLLADAFRKRQRFINYRLGSRIFYGTNDGLPGLIVDQFVDQALIQINTAGVDRYRNLIQAKVNELIKGQSYFLDDKKYREKEFLPSFPTDPLPQLKIIENDIVFSLRSEVLQKIGFYFDHRENRSQLMHILGRMEHHYQTGLDLFSYAGAWGLCALKAGLPRVEFVDQGDFSTEVEAALSENKFYDRGIYFRADVFHFLDDKIKKGEKFDVVMSDPPAFAKSLSQKNAALEGYSKLHRKVLRVSQAGALIVFSSCTHYVSHDEFQRNILEAASKEGKKLQLIFSGMQGWDHPVSSLWEKSNYIKSFFYLME